MNTDKLMELGRGIRSLADHPHAMSPDTKAKRLRAIADELAALRAEQAVGIARQPEGVVLVPRVPTAHMIESATGGSDFRTADCETLGDERALLRRQWAAMLAAAPGGEGEATQPERDGRGNG